MKNEISIESQILGLTQLSKSQQFNEATKISFFAHKNKANINKMPKEWKTIYYKGYIRLKQTLLPEPTRFTYNLYKSLVKRTSTRGFSSHKMQLKDFSQILYYAAGLKRLVTKENSYLRFYPSAGARYPLEIYPVVLNIESLKSGLYHYHIKSHSLENLPISNIKANIMKQFNQKWIQTSAVILLITAIFQRTEMKYKNRGLRHIYTEYGHLAQNLYLLSTMYNIGCCSIGGFLDDGINKILDTNGEDESVIGVVTLGSLGHSTVNNPVLSCLLPT